MASLEEADKFAADGATHPRITLDWMKSQVRTIYYTDGATLARHAHAIDLRSVKTLDPNLEIMTICMMVMLNGFVVIGKSAPLSPQNYDRNKGQVFAYEDCIRQLWPMYAFAAKEMGR